jgi:glyoxylase-like metal-dependent hydrolase (beta-lactamase superfamily II)
MPSSHPLHAQVGDISKFPSSELVLGPGTKALFPGYPENPKSAMLSAFIRAPSGKVREISSSEWQNIEGIWPRCIDFFGDGSFYLLDAPGHLPGHIMALAKTGDDEYVLMGGDACHDPLLFVYPEKYDISEKVRCLS